MKNTERIATLIVDMVINTMKLRFPDNAAAFEAARSSAVRTANNAIPFPLRLTINLIPASAVESVIKTVEQTVTKVVEKAIITIDPKTLSNATDVSAIVTEVVKTAVSHGIETVKGFIKGQPPDHSIDSEGKEQPVDVLLRPDIRDTQQS